MMTFKNNKIRLSILIIPGILLLYVSSYIVIRLNDIVIHGIHDRNHFVEYRSLSMGPIFRPAMFIEENLYNTFGRNFNR